MTNITNKKSFINIPYIVVTILVIIALFLVINTFQGSTDKIFREFNKYINRMQNKTEENFIGNTNIIWGNDKISENYRVKLGIFDPENLLTDQPNFKIKSFFSEWNNPEDLQQKLSEIKENEFPLITLEPHFDYKDPNQDYLNLLPQISSGKYDRQINDSCQVLNKFPDEILLRWGHEMDNLIGRYPWETYKPEEYINAFQYFTKNCRKIAPRIKLVWSPVGHSESIKYYPGDESVDLIGITLLNFTDFEKDYYGQIRSFDEMMQEKQSLLSKVDKRVIITEFGVTGNESFRMKWIKDAFSNFNKYPMLWYVVFFNSKDVEGVWGKKFITPDWRLSKSQIEEILN